MINHMPVRPNIVIREAAPPPGFGALCATIARVNQVHADVRRLRFPRALAALDETVARIDAVEARVHPSAIIDVWPAAGGV